MSKYIELLHRIAEGDNRGDFFISNELLKEIEAILAQPENKREPLSEEESYHEAKRLYEAEDGLWYADGFVDGLKFAENMHGITGGEE